MCEEHEETTTAATARPGRRTVVRAAGGLVVAGGALALGAPSALAATSQNGWPAGQSSALPLTGLAVGAATFPAGVRRGDVHTVLAYVAGRFDREVEKLVKGWCWGHAYRPIRGATTLSNHASGTAIDLNAPNHPLGKAGTFTAAQRTRIHAILADCGGVVRWGGDYSGRKDEMHLEINVRPGDARLAALAKRIGGGGGGTPTPAAWPTVRRGATGFRVSALQHLLRAKGLSVTADGVFGSVTASRVVAFQRSAGLVADGVVGAQTWPVLTPTVQQGSRGEAVTALQGLLTAKGRRTTADGVFGSATRGTVLAFQKAAGLTADGVVGDRTWAALLR